VCLFWTRKKKKRKNKEEEKVGHAHGHGPGHERGKRFRFLLSPDFVPGPVPVCVPDLHLLLSLLPPILIDKKNVVGIMSSKEKIDEII